MAYLERLTCGKLLRIYFVIYQHFYLVYVFIVVSEAWQNAEFLL